MSTPGASALEGASAAQYTRAAHAAADAVIRGYSTSFGMATRLLGGVVRHRVRSVYALVRVADEIVDGAAAGAGLTPGAVAEALDAYEAATERALATGFSTDLVVHAFADAARATGIGSDLTRPFFASMRADLGTTAHDPETFRTYVYGSAEVVGLMCLRIFVTDDSPVPRTPDPRLVDGAERLGAAFQKVNFLRDLQADLDGRGRAYFPDVDPAHLTDADRDRLLADIDADLAAAAAVVPLLPPTSRAAVRTAHDLFAELSARLHRTPAATLRTARVRVPDGRKAVLTARAVLRHPPRGAVLPPRPRPSRKDAP